MKRLLVTVLLLLGARSSGAAVIHVTPQVKGILNADFTPADPEDVVSLDPFHAVLRPRAEKYMVQIDVWMRIEDLLPGQGGFGNAAFNLSLHPRLSQNPELPGWQPDSSCICHGWPPDTLIPKWADNGDFGPSGSDLQSIIIGVSPRDFGAVGIDFRRTLGQNGPEYAGSVYLDLLGHDATGRLELITTGGSVYTDDLLLTTAGTTVVGGEVVISAVPEPAGRVLVVVSLGVGCACCLSRQRPVLQR